MNNHIKKIFAWPVALLFLFISTFFLTGCFCASPQPIAFKTQSISITSTELQSDTSFLAFVGQDNSSATTSTLFNVLVAKLLGSKTATDRLKKNVIKKAKEEKKQNFEKFYKQASSAYNEADLKIEQSQTTTTTFTYTPTNKTKQIKVPNDWTQVSKKNQVQIGEIKIEFKFTPDHKSSTNDEDYTIVVKFTNIKLAYTSDFVLDPTDLAPAADSNYEIESITESSSSASE